MRKLLILLTLFPILTFGQSSTDGLDIDLLYKGTTEDANKPLNKVQVNDTIVIALKLNNLDSSHQITYIHTDVQYDSDAYAMTSYTFNTPQNSQNTVGNWSNNGMKMQFNDQYDKNAVWAQWQYGTYLSANNDASATGWQVEHIQSVSPTDIGSVEYATIYFKVKDGGANHDYTENIIITMARATDNITSDNANNAEYVYPTGKVRAYETQWITHTPLEDLDSNIYVKLNANGNIDLTKIKVKVIEDGTEKADLAFDNGGTINITEYVISSTAEYKLQFHTTYTESEWQSLTENAVTLSDAVLVLKEVGAFGHGGSNSEFDYGIQYPNADSDADNTINPQDAYNILGHVIGSFNYYPGDSYAFATTFPIVKTDTYDDYKKSDFTNGTSIDGSHDKTIQSTSVTSEIDWSASTNNLEFKSTVLGDVNLSYSSAVATDGEGVQSINISNAPSLSSKRVMNPLYVGVKNSREIFGVGVADVEVNQAFLNTDTQLEGDEIVTTLTLTSEDVSGFQLKINYDTSRLNFDRVVFDTGNTTTNFAKQAADGRVNIGSLEQGGVAIANGSTVKVYFTGDVSSPVGVVTVFNTDAVNTNGERLILNLQ